MVEGFSPLEVFCSYAHEDEPFRQQLEKHLSLVSRRGLATLWHDRHIVPGADWAQAIDTHLKSASLILLLISADFLASDYCYGVEMQQALERHDANEARVIPILLRPCDWQNAPFAHLQVLPTNGKFLTTWRNEDEAYTDVVQGIRRALDDLLSPDLLLLPPSRSPRWNVPFTRNPFFMGREELLEGMHTHFQQTQIAALGQIQAISGLGGIGKTQLAVEYAYRYYHEYTHVFWVNADSPETLSASYKEIAFLLNLPKEKTSDQEKTVEAVKVWLRDHRSWLLILDNADNLDLRYPPNAAGQTGQPTASFLLITPGGHRLLTTRASALGRLGITRLLTVETFSLEQGALFLLRRAGRLAPNALLEQAMPHEQEQAKQIVHELGGLPLALEQAGAYLEETGTNLASYLQAYQQHRAQLLQQYQPLTYRDPVATTWAVSFSKVEQQNPAAAELLRFCAFLAPDAIPETFITKGAAKLGPVLAPIAADAYQFDQAIAALRVYSLISRDSDRHSLNIHRLVQAVVRDGLSARKQKQWKRRIINAACIVGNKEWPTEENLPHLLLCATWIQELQIVTLQALKLILQVGEYLSQRWRHEEGVLLFQRTLALCEQKLGPEHPYTAMILNDLAAFYEDHMCFEEAEPLYRRALEIREKTLGPEHPVTVESLNNLAALYSYQFVSLLLVIGRDVGRDLTTAQRKYILTAAKSKYKEAVLLFHRALEIWKQKYGWKHPYTRRALDNSVHLYNVGMLYFQIPGGDEETRKLQEDHMKQMQEDTSPYDA